MYLLEIWNEYSSFSEDNNLRERNMKWRVFVVPPALKRMAGTGVLTVTMNDSGEVKSSDKYTIAANAADAIFEVPDEYDWIGNTSKMDSSNFDVSLEYKNVTGSRTSRFRLVPEKVFD